ncbi:MAG TPA: hypothetical protein VIM94_12990 [Salegentibacter sp.]|uniref:hypothetical protein n=1 Tax=Salegentibacter sp. TaxID=1903072 RepID=UPI002F93EB02
MNELYENFVIFLIVSPLFFFIIAVSFRLLDNSALLFLQKEILVTSSNVSDKCIKHQISNHPDIVFTKKLRTALLFKKLHRAFIILMFTSVPLMLIGFFLSN